MPLSLAVCRPYKILPINPFCEMHLFSIDSIDASILQEAAKGVIPLKTEQSTLWAVKNFDCWVHARSSSSSNVVPPDLLHSHAELVCCFVLETRRPMDHATRQQLCGR